MDKNKISTFDKKDQKIIAQSTLKEAVKLCIAKRNVKFDYIKTVHKRLFDYMIKEEYR